MLGREGQDVSGLTATKGYACRGGFGIHAPTLVRDGPREAQGALEKHSKGFGFRHSRTCRGETFPKLFDLNYLLGLRDWSLEFLMQTVTHMKDAAFFAGRVPDPVMTPIMYITTYSLGGALRP